MTPLLQFLLGTGPDPQGRTIDDILMFDNETIEQDHRYIQWLFPLETMSENVWESPILTKEEKNTIKQSPEIQKNIVRALERMTSFYLNTDQWLQEDDHNHLRISRILIATRSLLGQAYATTFYDTLMKRIADTETYISPDNTVYWREAVGLNLKRGTKIYLDIDGTMIHEDTTENYGKPAAGLEEFLIAMRPFDTYWLTTHCREGDPARAREIMKAVLAIEYHADIDRIQPTVWMDLKTEALDWNSDFIWFDNDIFDAERESFKTAGEDQQVIEVNLRDNPWHLKEITQEILQKK